MNPISIHAIMSGEDRGFIAKLARLGLSCASPCYRAIVAIRNAMFDCGLRKPVKLPRPVISIGNITTGGTGKTPMVMELSRRLLAMGEKPGILTRGYRGGVKHSGSEKTSDEVELFRAAFGDAVPVEANANRVQGAAAMLRKHADISVFLLDDGFQHRQVFRDLDIVLIDATQPFGYGRLLPRGLLREPLDNLKRADVIIITRVNEVQPFKNEGIPLCLAQGCRALCYISGESHFWTARGTVPLLRVHQCWRDLKCADDTTVEVAVLREFPLFAFTGIGNPAAFEKMLRRHADHVVGVRVFPDHHAFTVAEVRSLIAQATAGGAKAMVTTEKDWTKIGALLDWKAQSIPIYRPRLDIEFSGAEKWNELETLIKTSLHGDEAG